MNYSINILFLKALLLFSFTAFSQSNTGIKYQAVIHDANNELLSSGTNISLQATIISGAISGTTVYQENFNQNLISDGIVSVIIGNGTTISTDEFKDIDWSSGSFFIKTSIDIDGGSNYKDIGTSQLLSVPLSLNANTANQVSVKLNSEIVLTTPTQGQLVFCTDCGVEGELQIYNGTKWTNMMGGATLKSM